MLSDVTTFSRHLVFDVLFYERKDCPLKGNNEATINSLSSEKYLDTSKNTFVERSSQYTPFTENASVALQQTILTHAHTKCPPVSTAYFTVWVKSLYIYRVTYQSCVFVRSIPYFHVIRAAVCTVLQIKHCKLEIHPAPPDRLQPDDPSAVDIVRILPSEVWSSDFAFVGNDNGVPNTVWLKKSKIRLLIKTSQELLGW